MPELVVSTELLKNVCYQRTQPMLYQWMSSFITLAISGPHCPFHYLDGSCYCYKFCVCFTVSSLLPDSVLFLAGSTKFGFRAGLWLGSFVGSNHSSSVLHQLPCSLNWKDSLVKKRVFSDLVLFETVEYLIFCLYLTFIS